jgi:hypothetical protein
MIEARVKVSEDPIDLLRCGDLLAYLKAIE